MCPIFRPAKPGGGRRLSREENAQVSVGEDLPDERRETVMEIVVEYTAPKNARGGIGSEDEAADDNESDDFGKAMEVDAK
ncbi:uncharacterized protein PHALS_13144 [Plasmopara halstedii]|uniref:Uncharacterized protein n=1 Tax=Plasmopara halstedii TaxID=4781 RepID=A0A0P1ANT0_PLAHL|nr:uncharacterized protein PHALS_13144 [Plasmopara halstedii]CEG42908.1 hypothetical protein PHALS_13144 [Plasmopara halstedii]|eukprot:XP_024579277.1 hypothetical protein PHALS_13144 [Plasmopara halstedii]